jgi:hypothetical protein
MASTDEGTRIDCRDEQWINADSPRVARVLQPRSNVKFESLWRPKKQDVGIVPIDDGMQIDWNAQHENANWPRIETLDGDSKVKVERRECARHDSPIVSTDEGMPTD